MDGRGDPPGGGARCDVDSGGGGSVPGGGEHTSPRYRRRPPCFRRAHARSYKNRAVHSLIDRTHLKVSDTHQCKSWPRIIDESSRARARLRSMYSMMVGTLDAFLRYTSRLSCWSGPRARGDTHVVFTIIPSFHISTTVLHDSSSQTENEENSKQH